MWDGSLDCKGAIAQGFPCSRSLSGGIQLELFYISAPLSKFIWSMLCQRLWFRKARVEPEE